MKNRKWERETESEREGELKRKCIGEGKGYQGRARLN
jgi:hypothetical protein